MTKAIHLPFKVYDCETQKMADEVEGKWNNITGMKLSSCVVYDSILNQYKFFGPDKEDDVAEELNGTDHIVVGYNSFNFDSKLILGNDRQSEKNMVYNEKYSWLELDIYLEILKKIVSDEICKKYNEKVLSYNNILNELRNNRQIRGTNNCFTLNNVCWATLRQKKNGVGADGPKLFKEGKIDKLFEYNMNDTKMTKDLYLFATKYRHVNDGNYEYISFL